MIGGWPEGVKTGRLDPLWTTAEGPAGAEPFGLCRIGAHAALRPRVKPPRLDPHPRLACAPIRRSEMPVICGTGHYPCSRRAASAGAKPKHKASQAPPSAMDASTSL